ncbi:hypothetical protein CERZMDRAFT_100619 [Cercospora zeae-maydis SCOH1-5]|uniref:BRCT domain-containing protein n=1 Tax=Cercospora zeae-maydis SCOH1-5 TaxID=717836 RepID=A0A6A6F7Q3_9PEZI|nr:hypothetical protein CERZMDRAFT_100619 [Cercospora zeae-maydis SCOH1-5]
MVSTRGGARTSTGDAATTLNKRPARKLATATVKLLACQTTRARKAVPRTSSADHHEEDEIDELAAPAPPSVKATRRGRPAAVASDKPADKSDTKQTTKPGATTNTTAKKATLSAATRTSKVGRSERQTVKYTQSHAVPELKGAQSRATRPTRATAGKEKAAPLSPRKITQVLKAKVGATNFHGKKPAGPPGPAARVRSIPEKRNVSDENANALGPSSSIDDEGRPSRAPKRRKVRADVAADDVDADPRSTKATPSPDSIPPLVDAAGVLLRDFGPMKAEDDLCAPNTPMKRSDLQYYTNYHATEATPVARVDVPFKTPIRRFKVLGTLQGTPQTQRPYYKPKVSLSEVGPMTVARARDIAIASPRLQPLPCLPPGRISEFMQHQLELPRQCTNGHRPERENSHMSLLVGASTRYATLQHEQDSTSAAESLSAPEMDDIDPDEATYNEHSISQHNVYLPMELSMTIAASGSPSAITCPSSSVDDENFVDQPEINDWENVPESVTTPFGYDDDLTLPKAPPQPEPAERLINPSDSRSGVGDKSDATSMTRPAVLRSAEVRTVCTTNLPELRQIGVSTCDSPEQAANMSNSLEAASITPPREEVCKPDTDAVLPRNPRIEEDSEDDATFDGHQTFVCDEADKSWAVATTPLKIVTAEAVEEEDAKMEGDITLMIEEPACSSDSNHSPIRLVTAEEVLDEDQDAVEGEITLLLEEPRYPGMITCSPIEFVTMEDIPDNRDTIEGDVTLAISSPLPQQLANAASVKESGKREDTCLEQEDDDISWSVETMRSFRRAPPIQERTAEQVPTDDNVTEKSLGLPTELNDDDLDNSSTNSPSPDPYHPSQIGNEPLSQGTPSVLTYQNSHEHLPAEAPSRRVAADAYSWKRRSLHGKAAMDQTMAATPTRALSSRQMLSEDAEAVNSAAVGDNSRTPARQFSGKRPATAQKPVSLRKIALQATSTPMKRTFKASGDTPGDVTMTPHPSAPLRGVVALVDVYTHDGACVSQSFAMLLRRLGAKTTKTFSDSVTHVVFKEGNPRLIQALTTYNMKAAKEVAGKEIYCVNSRWVNDCNAHGRRVPECDEGYIFEVDEYTRSTRRRRKSMEPTSLLKTNGGDIIRDRRTPSGRLSNRRVGMKNMLDRAGHLSTIDTGDEENSEDSQEPATPTYLKEPNSLIQHTMPAKRVHMLNLGAKADTQRRLTFADGLSL